MLPWRGGPSTSTTTKKRCVAASQTQVGSVTNRPRTPDAPVDRLIGTVEGSRACFVLGARTPGLRLAPASSFGSLAFSPQWIR
jgi:hypothetical protein